jgi:hypothetical protein
MRLTSFFAIFSVLCAPACSSSNTNSGDTATTTNDAADTATSPSDAADTATSDTGPVTWTELYAGIFGPTGTSSCSLNGGCHTGTNYPFSCGTTATSCFTGLVNVGLITPGANASSSTLVDPNSSPLCGTLGGTMPQSGACVTDAQIAQIKAWLATGAPDN